MPLRQDEWQRRIKSVDREYAASRLAIDRLLVDAADDPNIIKEQLQVREIKTASDELEATYIVRLFSEFETSLRAYWRSVRHTRPPRQARNLVDGVAVRARVPYEFVANAHSVREYRNLIVHEEAEAADPVTILVARRYLCRFLARLPHEW